MRTKVLYIVLCLALLTGCVEPIELEFAVTEMGFPLGFTRISDGAQINLGMSRSEIESILNMVSDYEFEDTGVYEWGDEVIGISYNYDGVAWSIGIFDRSDIVMPSGDWAIVGRFSIGSNISDVIDSSKFTYIVEGGQLIIYDAPRNPTYGLVIGRNENDTIRSMQLIDIPARDEWYDQ